MQSAWQRTRSSETTKTENKTYNAEELIRKQSKNLHAGVAFDDSQDLLVIPNQEKYQSFDGGTLKLIERLDTENRVIRLDFIHKPAMVKAW